MAPVLPRAGASPVTVGVAHMVREQVIATHAKSKMAANLLRLGFIEFFLVLGFSVYICVGLFLAAVQNVFLPGKAEIAVQTRQVFVSRVRTLGNVSLYTFLATTAFQLRGADEKPRPLVPTKP